MVVEIIPQSYAASPEDCEPKINKEHLRTAEVGYRFALANMPLLGPAAKAQVVMAGEIDPQTETDS